MCDGGSDDLEEDLLTLLGEDIKDPNFLEDARGMLRMKGVEWKAEIHRFLFLDLDDKRDKSFVSVMLGESIPFDPGILELRSNDASLLEVPHASVDFLIPHVEPIMLIQPISFDLAPDLSIRSCEVSGWFIKYVQIVIIISANLPPNKFTFCN